MSSNVPIRCNTGAIFQFPVSKDTIKLSDYISIHKDTAQTQTLNVTETGLAYVRDWIEMHAGADNSQVPTFDMKQGDWVFDFDIRLTEREVSFFQDIEEESLVEVFEAARLMRIPLMVHQCAQAIANFVKGKSTNEIRKAFRISNENDDRKERSKLLHHVDFLFK